MKKIQNKPTAELILGVVSISIITIAWIIFMLYLREITVFTLDEAPMMVGPFLVLLGLFFLMKDKLSTVAEIDIEKGIIVIEGVECSLDEDVLMVGSIMFFPERVDVDKYREIDINYLGSSDAYMLGRLHEKLKNSK